MLRGVALAALSACGAASAAAPLSPEGARFVERIHRMADTTDFFDIAQVQRDIALRLAVDTSGREFMECGGGDKSERRTTSWRADPGGWYVRQPSGAGDVRLPAIAINPAASTGEPRLAVESMALDRCGAHDPGHRRVTVTFAGLPAYACITAAQVRELIPAAQRQMATDGYSLVRYAGRRTGDATVEARFAFRFGTDCAVAAEVTQESDRAPPAAK